MPNKTIYCSDGDLPLFQKAQDLAKGNLSLAISLALTRYVDVEEGKRDGYDEIIVRAGPGAGRKVRFVGVLLAEWMNSDWSRVESFRVYRSRTGKYVLHIERSPEYKMLDSGREARRFVGPPWPRELHATRREPASRRSRSFRRSRSCRKRSRPSSSRW